MGILVSCINICFSITDCLSLVSAVVDIVSSGGIYFSIIVVMINTPFLHDINTILSEIVVYADQTITISIAFTKVAVLFSLSNELFTASINLQLTTDLSRY